MTDGDPGSSEPTPDRIDALLSGVRFGQFASVGIVGAAFDFTVLVLLVEGFTVLPELAKLASIESAILVMFAINERWTFANEGDAGLGPTLRRLGRSHAVRAVGSLAQIAVFTLVSRYLLTSVELFGIEVSLLVVNAFAIGSGVLLNYTFESLWTWKVHEDE